MRSLLVIICCLCTTGPALAQSAEPAPSRLAQLLKPTPKNPRLARLLLPAPADPLIKLGVLTRYLHFGVQIANAGIVRGYGGAAHAKAVGESWLGSLAHLPNLSADMRRVATSLTHALAQGDDADVATLSIPEVKTAADEQLTVGIWAGSAYFGTTLPDDLRSALATSGRALANRPGLDAVQRGAIGEAAAALARGDDQALHAAINRLVDHIR